MALRLIDRFNRIQKLLADRSISIHREDRIFHDRSNPLELYDHIELYEKFRFTREGIVWLIELLSPELMRPTARNRAIPPVIQICITLRFFATGNFQSSVGGRFGVSQSSVSRIVAFVTKSIKALANDFIKYPQNEQEINKAKQGFLHLGGMPNIVGAIDCTHIRIRNPSMDEFAYLNDKNYHSINVQAICNSDCIFTNITVKYPGSMKDLDILTNSMIYEDLEAGRKTGILLGDSAYMSKKYLLTPYKRPETAAETQFNAIHSRHRIKIDHLFEMWKRRFLCLHKELRVAPEKACDIIIACAVLHNEAMKRNMQPFLDDKFEDEQPDIQNYTGENNSGEQLRQYYTNFYGGIVL